VITRISLWISYFFYLPTILIAKASAFVAGVLFKSAYRKVGHCFYGYRSKIALKLSRYAMEAGEEITTEMVAWSTQITKEEIMKAIRADKAYPYVVKDERDDPESEQTTFMCRYIDPKTAASLGDQLYNVSGVGSNRRERLLTGSQQLKILKACLVDWKNMTDDDGKEIPFEKEKIVEMVGMIPPKYRRELADFIQGESEVEEGEELD
jgi:hypothetical protein